MFSPSIILCFSLLCLCLAYNLVFITCSPPSLRNTSSSNLCHEDEYYALLHLKESFSFFTRANTYYAINTNNTRSWKRGSDCCEWDGITCHPLTHHVIALDLYNNGIVGTINSNSNLFQLGQLQRLNLSWNDFSSSNISHKFGQFHFLKHLDLSYSYFSGRVPLEISQLTRLTSLDLSGNDLQFSNVKLVIGNLTKLKRLGLSGIKLETSQIFQTTTNLSSLSYLNLEGCYLQGEFSTSILNLPHLKELNLGYNDAINFHFPSMYNWSSPLESLILSYSNISSNIPSFYSRLTHLKSLYLQSTNLRGTFPSWVWNISERIDLSHNELTGSLPSTMNISKLSSLTTLYLGKNMLVGEVPAWLFSLKSLDTINLSFNNFRGSVSLYHVFSSLPKLRSLFLSNSGLSVTITDGPVNSSVISTLANSLQYLGLSNTSIHGEFPKWLQQLIRESSINLLDLSSNSLTGVLENLPWGTLNYIEISNNKLTGRLPIISSPYTQFFLAANNNFTGPIDSSICNLTSLWVLDLSNNSLSGDFPHCLGSLNSGLNLLNLGSNNIHGTLPTNFSKCDNLRYLDISSNRLQGQLPRSLARCTNLQAINLRSNELKDEFPYWLHTLPFIRLLDLSCNSFHGHINNVSGFHPYPALQILDLSSNNFSGKIPTTYINKFQAMTRIIDHHGFPQYMESNVPMLWPYYSIMLTFKGVQLPYEKIIETLSFFDLSNNAFEGEIPEYVIL
ncbi:receptor-like protein 12 [Chenopodium quinoa]|uniref:receptor-like protein 12 n=1 Tax=Chenopodium quinoa TaxID=63459 RepID=UPI000B78EE07|nr:receptor-like protein 12 [Chenopodium quinoa]